MDILTDAVGNVLSRPLVTIQKKQSTKPKAGRLADCEGKKIEKPELDEAKKEFKWEKAEEPAAPPKPAAA